MKHILIFLSLSFFFTSPLFGQSFVSVGNSGTILTSSDGISWTKRTSRKWGYLKGVTSGNGLFVTDGNSGTILTSPDGNSWTKRTSGTSKYLRGVTYGNGLFVTVGFLRNHPHFTGWNHLD